jgi:hypothetical protein
MVIEANTPSGKIKIDATAKQKRLYSWGKYKKEFKLKKRISRWY